MSLESTEMGKLPGATGVGPDAESLLEAVVGNETVSEEALAELARRAGWAPSATVQPVALAGATGVPLPVLPRTQALVRGDTSAPYLLIPDPGEDTAGMLVRALRGRPAAVGPAVRLGEVRSSLGWARKLLALFPEGDISTTRLMHVEDHLVTLMILQDQELARFLAARWLHPLESRTYTQSQRIVETLLTWLQFGGRAPETAKALGVHPQTVRYRMRLMEGLFGGALRDPRRRFELELAVRGGRLIAEFRHRQYLARRRALREAEGSLPLRGHGRAGVNGV
ncbi:PucR family transcriptional regulator [Streptomyces sp. HUAS TT7]|uniref:PucR family transcriptional regulator n=1 Tax=Streptomyces sp. HUAS TT7 TaxID=3447507 RepID=UPI003F65AFAC